MQNTLLLNTNNPEIDTLDATAVADIDSAIGTIVAAGKKSIEQTFDIAAALTSIKSHVSERLFSELVEEKCNMTTRSAWNYIQIDRRFRPLKKHMIKLSIGYTVMVHLLKGTDEQVDSYMNQVENGGKNSVAAAQLFLLGENQPVRKVATDPFATSGLFSLKKIAEDRNRAELAAFQKCIDGLNKCIGTTLLSGERINQTKLAGDLERYAKGAIAVLDSICSNYTFVSDAEGPLKREFPEDSIWFRDSMTLTELADVRLWPKDNVKMWFLESALPALGRMVSKDPMVSVVDEDTIVVSPGGGRKEILPTPPGIQPPKLDPIETIDADLEYISDELTNNEVSTIPSM